jgi:hypothetical protein
MKKRNSMMNLAVPEMGFATDCWMMRPKRMIRFGRIVFADD